MGPKHSCPNVIIKVVGYDLKTRRAYQNVKLIRQRTIRLGFRNQEDLVEQEDMSSTSRSVHTESALRTQFAESGQIGAIPCK